MKIINDINGLDQHILYLEQRRQTEKEVVSAEINSFMESLKPVNLLKGLFSTIRRSPDLKTDIFHGILGLGTGFLTNKLFLGSSRGPIKNTCDACSSRDNKCGSQISGNN